MRRFFIIALTFTLLLSCNKDDNDNSSSTNSINPPGWLHGVWVGDYYGFEFTNNNILELNYSGDVAIDHRELYIANGQYGQIKIEETVSSDFYSYKVSSMGVLLQSYKFRKHTSNTIKYEFNEDTYIILTKQ